ncbi:hypothetical protein J6590_079826 [Homalodisca vitripennis]|nr:hypothetical protein J6590_079826 [Homalodisca vitripennis]
MPNAAQSTRSYNFEELHLINFRTSTTDKRQYAVAANTRCTSRCCQCVRVACLYTGHHTVSRLHVASVPSTPAASSSTAASPAVCTGPVATPSAPNTPITVSHSPTYFSDLVSENTALRKELTDLKLQLQSVLDHSIESDQRLLQLTNEIFTTKPSTSTNSQSRPALINQHSQTESASSDLLFPDDSHSRHLSAILRAHTSGHTNIIGVCKPGPGLLYIAPYHAPPENHCYVPIAGINDLVAGRQDIVFQHMEEVIKNCRISSNLLVSPLPPRYDLPLDNPIHESIALANSYLSELCERYEGVAMMNISDLGREHFTPHVLHLATTGKSLLGRSDSEGVNQSASSPLQNPRSYCSTPVTIGTTDTTVTTDTNRPASQLRGGCDQPTCWAVHRSQSKVTSVRP